ncbi:MAG: hypothetical protein OEW00_08915 [candidate division Zixibacteria bacterium]|nr:hypothetical protein [candidate division Zixibacteria bacterium]
MNRKGCLLGLYSVGGQVLLLRELVSSLNGDELFIGTALFGWLLSVAAGAWLGGKRPLAVSSGALFTIGVVVLPLVVVLTRLSPLAVTDIVAETVPFSAAVLISVLMMLPVGLISGWLFPTITRERENAADAIVLVYLFEGIGAFVGGLMITLLVGPVVTTLEMAVLLGVVVLYGAFLSRRPAGRPGGVLTVAVALVVLIAARNLIPFLDVQCDIIKYHPYHVEKAFDTHYGRQVLLTRDSTLALITDNTTEAVYPDLAAAENRLLPPLAYHPAASRLLYVGRPEFGAAQLADSLSELSITAVDPRGRLSEVMGDYLPVPKTLARVHDDPLAFFSRRHDGVGFDIVILNPGNIGSFKGGRLLTLEFLRTAKTFLTDRGILYLPLDFDTDRYVTAEQRDLLAVVYGGLKESFGHVAVWPGTVTAMFASDAPLFDIPVDSIAGRLSHMTYSPRYVSEDYLYDRLNDLKVDRLAAALNPPVELNTLNRPVLTHMQALYSAKAHNVDKALVAAILKNPGWQVFLPVVVILFLASAIASRDTLRRRRRFGLFLYFTAGIVSLSLELISFYVYQSSAGSLFSEMAVLIGAFMLGLALGTYYAVRWGADRSGHASLGILLAAAIAYRLTYASVPPHLQLFYSICFLLAVAVATGLLFAFATRRYYGGQTESNRGLGYACELLGSSMGALFTTTILLPVIGLSWLLVSLAMLVGVTLLVSLVMPAPD